jgi:hypothetical protein
MVKKFRRTLACTFAFVITMSAAASAAAAPAGLEIHKLKTLEDLWEWILDVLWWGGIVIFR